MTSRMTAQKKVLLLGAVFAALFLAYSVFRYMPAQAVILQQAQSTEEKNERVQSIRREQPEAPGRDPAQLRQELAELEQSLDREQQQLTLFEQQFAPEDSPEALQDLRVRISELATSHGVRIRESVPYIVTTDSPPASPLLSVLAFGNPYQRSLQRLTLESSFSGLRQCLEQLKELPWKVVVMDFEIEVAASPDGARSPSLRTTLTVVF